MSEENENKPAEEPIVEPIAEAKEEPIVEVQENTNTTVNEKKGKSITAMVLGIVSITFCCAWYVSIPCAILGLVFGIIGNKEENAKGMAKTGIILGVIALALDVLVILGLFTLLGLGTTLIANAR